MNSQATKLLGVVVVVTIVIAIIAVVRMIDAQRAAMERMTDLDRVRANLAAMSAAPGSAAAASPAAGGDLQINRAFRAASAAAGALDQLRSVEPGQPSRLRDTDFVETPIFVRFDGTPLRRVVMLLAQLCAQDRNVNVTSIELSSPATATAAPASTGEELWTADLTLGILAYSPRQ
jgi:hypothetical protein